MFLFTLGLLVEDEKLQQKLILIIFQSYHSLLADDKTNSKNFCIRRLPKEITDPSITQSKIQP